jgi:hypothetical protein
VIKENEGLRKVRERFNGPIFLAPGGDITPRGLRCADFFIASKKGYTLIAETFDHPWGAPSELPFLSPDPQSFEFKKVFKPGLPGQRELTVLGKCFSPENLSKLNAWGSSFGLVHHLDDFILADERRLFAMTEMFLLPDEAARKKIAIELEDELTLWVSDFLRQAESDSEANTELCVYLRLSEGPFSADIANQIEKRQKLEKHFEKINPEGVVFYFSERQLQERLSFDWYQLQARALTRVLEIRPVNSLFLKLFLGFKVPALGAESAHYFKKLFFSKESFGTLLHAKNKNASVEMGVVIKEMLSDETIDLLARYASFFWFKLDQKTEMLTWTANALERAVCIRPNLGVVASAEKSTTGKKLTGKLVNGLITLSNQFERLVICVNISDIPFVRWAFLRERTADKSSGKSPANQTLK